MQKSAFTPAVLRARAAAFVLWLALALVAMSVHAADAVGQFVQERFQQLDKNHDGRLSATELSMPKLFKQMDANNDGSVTRAEADKFFSDAATRLTDRVSPRIGGNDYETNAMPGEESPRQAPKPLKPSEHGVGMLAPDVDFTDIDGKTWRLNDLKDHKALVVVVTSTSCPLSRKYAPALARLEKSYREKGVTFVFVNPVASDKKADMRAAVKTHRFAGPYVHDADGALAKALGAVTTTDALVLDAARTVVFHGAVDDQYGFAYALNGPRHRYLADALDATLAGRAPTVAATTAPGCALDLTKAPAQAVAKVTYHNRISRLMQDNCMECHRQGGVGPFTLESFEDVTGHAGMIRKQVERGVMPPWFAAPPKAGEHSPWANDRSLAARDKQDLLAWLSAGRPPGNASDAPLPRKFPSDWQIGQPDLIVQIPQPIAVKAEGTMPYQNVTVETKLTADKWISAFEVQPTAREVVHHVLVFVRLPSDPENPKARREGDEERAGFFAAYVPGNSTRVFPEGFAKLLPAISSLKFQIHYTPTGKATRDQVRIGMVFAKEPPRHVVHVIGLVNPLLSIPPGAANHEEHAGIPILKEAKVLSYMPHMHVRGKAFRYEAVYADGRTQTLLDVPRYDFNWQLAYRYAEPLTLPRGARLRATGWFDNSTANPANPDPLKTVRWGPQTTDEMMLGYVEYYFPDEKPKTAVAQR
jgi:thiol-disulfide isomerase/thioredoxin/mono/diheme cytochrome c family protein